MQMGDEAPHDGVQARIGSLSHALQHIPGNLLLCIVAHRHSPLRASLPHASLHIQQTSKNGKTPYICFLDVYHVERHFARELD
jgi:hypothetical protein